VNAFIILDKDGRQVFGLDDATRMHLYRRGDRVFKIGHGMSVKILCDLPTARDAYNPGNSDCQNANPNDGETTIHRIGRFVRGLFAYG
jgi:hypothetical protein